MDCTYKGVGGWVGGEGGGVGGGGRWEARGGLYHPGLHLRGAGGGGGALAPLSKSSPPLKFLATV